MILSNTFPVLWEVQPHKNSDSGTGRLLRRITLNGTAGFSPGTLPYFHPARASGLLTPQQKISGMQSRNILISGIAAGFLLLVLMMVSGFLVNMVMPADMSQYEGMRAMDDPVMTLFYLYPFVVAFAAAGVFDCVKGCLKGDSVQKGLQFGGLLLLIMTVPSLYVMVTSMTWPLDFYISTGIWEIISFPLMGILFARIWDM